MSLAYLKRICAVVMLSSITIVSFADDAPVYEADNYPPPFDGQPYEGANEMDHSPPPIPSVAQSAPPPQAYYPPQTSYRSLPTDQRLARLEQQTQNLQQSNSKTEALQKEVQVLRGQVEVLMHQLQQSQTQQRAMYADLDKRLSGQMVKPALENDSVAPPKPAVPAAKPAPAAQPAVVASATPPAPAPIKKPAPEQPNAAEEQQIYQTAYDLIKAKKYNEAINTLQKMLQKYPSGQFAANAHYWLGELYGLLNKSDQSALEFNKVIKNYPESPKVVDAQLKLGLIYSGQFKWTEAKEAFKKVIARSPGTESARVAKEQLKQIKQTGH